MKQYIAIKILFWLLVTTNIFAQGIEIPDPNLEQAVREALELPMGETITRQRLLTLTGLEAKGKHITNLVGLQNATNLEYLDLNRNNIKDITPLKQLVKLKVLILWNNQITNITSLANLNKLEELWLRYNLVADLTPLAHLANLQILDIRDNLATDFTPLQRLNLVEFYYDEVCNISPLDPPVRERIENRNFPSVCQSHDHVQGQDRLSEDQRYALHDLFWSARHEFEVHWDMTPSEPSYGIANSYAGNIEYARQVRRRWLDLNPNMVFLVEVRLHNHFTPEAFPPDSDFWIRDSQGEIVQNDVGEYLIDFLKPTVQELLINRIIAVAQCGLFDGIKIDGFLNNATGFVGRQFYSATNEEIITATKNILRAARSQVHDDFLIIVNTNRSKATRYAKYVNGTFMETGKDYEGGYTHEGLKEIESTLIWSEQNFRSPQINCLEGWGMSIEPPDGQNNRRWMRVFTTMTLTLSNGYVLYNINRNMPGDPHHWHLWYPFWDADLGLPIGPKVHQYQNTEGLFIREFTNGWAVYNRSSKPQTITLPRASIGVYSNRSDTTHLLPDLDGEIYLRIGKPYDLNRDGTINILDLILVSQHFGTIKGDINGDGTTDILDLTLVAQQFSK